MPPLKRGTGTSRPAARIGTTCFSRVLSDPAYLGDVPRMSARVIERRAGRESRHPVSCFSDTIVACSVRCIHDMQCAGVIHELPPFCDSFSHTTPKESTGIGGGGSSIKIRSFFGVGRRPKPVEDNRFAQKVPSFHQVIKRLVESNVLVDVSTKSYTWRETRWASQVWGKERAACHRIQAYRL